MMFTMNDCINLLINQNSFSKITYRLITLDPSKSDGRFYQALWKPYSQYGDRLISYSYIPLCSNMELTEEKIKTKWKPVFGTVPIFSENIFTFYPSVSIASGVFVTNPSPGNISKINVGGGVLGGPGTLDVDETRYFVYSSNEALGNIVMMISDKHQKQFHEVGETRHITFQSEIDYCLLVHGSNPWGQALTIQEGQDDFIRQLSQSRDLLGDFLAFIEKKETSYGCRGDTLNILYAYHADENKIPAQHVCIRGLPLHIATWASGGYAIKHKVWIKEVRVTCTYVPHFPIAFDITWDSWIQLYYETYKHDLCNHLENLDPQKSISDLAHLRLHFDQHHFRKSIEAQCQAIYGAESDRLPLINNILITLQIAPMIETKSGKIVKEYDPREMNIMLCPE